MLVHHTCTVRERKYGTPVSGWQQQLVSRIGVPEHAPPQIASIPAVPTPLCDTSSTCSGLMPAPSGANKKPARAARPCSI